jgi:serine/threonine-protein kinase
LAQRTDPSDDRPRFLKVVEQVSQAVAYAHSKGVIHRDLKPANVMVGAFGEVLGMDWGVAKVLGPAASQASLPSAPATGDVLPRLPEGAERQTQAGTTLGTPAYMAPEQARGEIDCLDERTDVFGLGAILCEVLTGQPPYTGSDSLSVLYQAAHGELAEAFAQLNRCGADPELIELARRCLAAARDERPRTAADVAQGLTSYLAGVEARLRRAELAAAEAAVRLREQRKRLRLWAVSAGLVLLLLGSAGWVWQLKSRQAAKDAEVQEAVAHAEPEALRLTEAGRYGEAEAVVQRLEGLVRGGPGATDLPPRVAQLRADLDMLRAIDEIRQDLVARLAIDRGDRGHFTEIATRYQEAFRRYGLDVMALEPAEAAAQLRGRAIGDALLAAVEHWHRVTADAAPTKPRLGEVLSAADPDPASFRNRWRAAAQKKDRAALVKLAELPEVETLPPVRLALVGDELVADVVPETIQLLRRARDRYPSDSWLNFWLAYDLWKMEPARKDEAIRFATAAQSLRPQMWVVPAVMGHLFDGKGDKDESIRCWQRAIELNPAIDESHYNLGVCFLGKGDMVAAIRCYREAIRHNPRFLEAHYNLGQALSAQGDRDGAIACYRAALNVDRKFAEAFHNLGNHLADQGKLDEAIAASRQAVELPPRLIANPAAFHANLSAVLYEAGDYPGALAAARKAIELDPNNILARFNLAEALARTGHFTEALAGYRCAERLLTPKDFHQETVRTAVRQAEQVLRAEAKLPAILKGEAQPADAEEQRALAWVGIATHRYAMSARFFAAAFAAQPDLERTDDRCDAAGAAAQAGSGRGEDMPQPDAREPAHWRQQAVQWLQAEVDCQRTQLAHGQLADRYTVQKTLRLLLRRTELAGIRDDAELRKLPAEERAACQRLWADIAALLAEADPPGHGSTNR